MARTAISVAIGIIFVAAVIWSAFSESAARCEICVDYKGRSACSVAAASDLTQLGLPYDLDVQVRHSTGQE